MMQLATSLIEHSDTQASCCGHRPCVECHAFYFGFKTAMEHFCGNPARECRRTAAPKAAEYTMQEDCKETKIQVSKARRQASGKKASKSRLKQTEPKRITTE